MKSELKKKKLAFVKVSGAITFKKRFPKLVHSIITRIDINFIDYLHALNIFLMKSWYAEGSRSHPQFSEKTRSPHRTFQPMN